MKPERPYASTTDEAYEKLAAYASLANNRPMTPDHLIRILRDPYNTADLRGWEDQVRLLENMCFAAADLIEKMKEKS